MKYEISLFTNRYCELCGTELGYLNPQYKIYYKNGDPKKVNTYFSISPHKSGENRKRCFDCFVLEFDRLPVRQNVKSEDLDWLLQIDTKEDRKLHATTLDNLIKKYGYEEANERWKKYCEFQSIKNTFEYKRDNLGWNEKQFEEYNKSRAITLELCIKRHGETKGIEIFENYKKKQAYSGCALEWFQEKHGKENGRIIWKNVNNSKAQTLDNYIKKYGVIEGEIRWMNHVENSKTNFFSVLSQELFNEIDKVIGNEYNCRYGNDEFGIYDSIHEKYYKYDFCINELKKIIEFNGSYWHADPRIYEENEKIKFPGGRISIAKDIWLSDDIKIHCANKRLFKVFIVWEQDYLENKHRVIEECLNFIEK